MRLTCLSRLTRSNPDRVSLVSEKRLRGAKCCSPRPLDPRGAHNDHGERPAALRRSASTMLLGPDYQYPLVGALYVCFAVAINGQPEVLELAGSEQGLALSPLVLADPAKTLSLGVPPNAQDYLTRLDVKT